jgi:hypothetical protein
MRRRVWGSGQAGTGMLGSPLAYLVLFPHQWTSGRNDTYFMLTSQDCAVSTYQTDTLCNVCSWQGTKEL